LLSSIISWLPWSKDSRLYKAIKLGQPDLVRHLLEAGADPNYSKGSSEGPVLLFAVHRGKVFVDDSVGFDDAIRRWLNQQGIDPRKFFVEANANERSLENFKALLYQRHIDCVKLLIDAGADPNPLGLSALLVAADSAVAQMLINAGSDPNEADAAGLTPLRTAAENGHIGVAKVLLAAGAGVDTTDNEEVTPLRVATGAGNTEMAALLLGAGANPNIKDKKRVTPLMVAAGAGHAEITALLLQAGADPNIKSTSGNTAMAWSAIQENPDIVKILIEGGTHADEYAKPLRTAVAYGNIEVTKVLLAAGVDPNIRADNGIRPLHLAAQKGQYKVVKLLLEHGADPNVEKVDGLTPLMYGVLSAEAGELDESESIEMIKTLVRAGADPGRTTRKGTRAEDFTRHSAFIQALRETTIGTVAISDKVRELIAALEPTIEHDGNADIHGRSDEAALSLAKIGEPAVQALIQALPRSSYAHLALGLIGGERAFQALCQELDTGNWRRVCAAAKALGRMGDPRALDLLKAQSHTSVAEVHQAVNTAIARIERNQREGERWLEVDKANPRKQVEHVRSLFDDIRDDPAQSDDAIRWARELAQAMPGLAFDSDEEKGYTWGVLGTLIFYLLNPDKRNIEGECPEAARAFEESLKYKADQPHIEAFLKQVS